MVTLGPLHRADRDTHLVDQRDLARFGCDQTDFAPVRAPLPGAGLERLRFQLPFDDVHGRPGRDQLAVDAQLHAVAGHDRAQVAQGFPDPATMRDVKEGVETRLMTGLGPSADGRAMLVMVEDQLLPAALTKAKLETDKTSLNPRPIRPRWSTLSFFPVRNMTLTVSTSAPRPSSEHRTETTPGSPAAIQRSMTPLSSVASRAFCSSSFTRWASGRPRCCSAKPSTEMSSHLTWRVSPSPSGSADERKAAITSAARGGVDGRMGGQGGSRPRMKPSPRERKALTDEFQHVRVRWHVQQDPCSGGMAAASRYPVVA